MQRAAKCIDIGSMVSPVRIFGLLRSHVVVGPHHGFAICQLLLLRRFGSRVGLVDPSQPKIKDLQGAFLIEDQVPRFDIAVDQPLLVGVLKTNGRLPDDLTSVSDR